MRSDVSPFSRSVVFLLIFALGGLVAGEAAGKVEPETATMTTAEKAEVAVDEWLVVGPVPVALPAFRDEGDFELASLLASEPPESLTAAWPAAGDRLAWPPHGERRWRTESGGLALAAGDDVEAVYAVVYLEGDRFLEPALRLWSPQRVRVWLDGEELAAKTAAGAAEGKPDLETTAALVAGKHLLVVQALRDPADGEPWRLRAELALPAERAASLAVSTSPRRGVRLADLVDRPGIDAVTISPDGEHVAVALERPMLASEDQQRWVEVRRAADGEVVRTLWSGTGFDWAPSGARFAYLTRGEKGATLWLGSLSGGLEPLLENVEGFGGYLWAPDGKSIVFTARQPAEPDERGFKRYRGLADRWSGWRDGSHLHQVFVPSGQRRRLSAGRVSDALQDVSPDGRRVLFSRSDYDRFERPFVHTDLHELDLETLEVRGLPAGGWLDGASYAPDGRRILVRGGPSLFGGAGDATPPGRFANEYDSQLFVLDRETGEVDALTLDYDPTVLDAVWSPHDGRIYLRALEGSHVRLVVYDPGDGTFRALETGLEVVEQASVARAAGAIAYHGSSAAEPQRARVLPSPGSRPRTLLVPGEERFARVAHGRVEPWSFTAAGGGEVSGRVYYPPDFDPARRYPLIVEFYAGVVPVDRQFGGRYPKELWAARGYVVYVLQPSGAGGFGQEFSSRHANDWGERTGGEILEGVERFLAAHPFVDAEQVGAIGGSYGGFIVMSLLTRSDFFAAAVAHAGISDLAGYWGAGWWGFLYSAVASAESFPWNAPELYVDRSPLYRADRIETPLLLLHGAEDVNVPPEQSHEMYTALRLLGREVELIEIGGENHQILTYDRQKLWIETILAWFDRHLKDQDEHWLHLWGSEDEPRG